MHPDARNGLIALVLMILLVVVIVGTVAGLAFTGHISSACLLGGFYGGYLCAICR